MVGKAWRQELRQLVTWCIHSQKAWRDERYCSAPFLLFIESGTPPQEMVLSTFTEAFLPQFPQIRNPLLDMPQDLSLRYFYVTVSDYTGILVLQLQTGSEQIAREPDFELHLCHSWANPAQLLILPAPESVQNTWYALGALCPQAKLSKVSKKHLEKTICNQKTSSSEKPEPSSSENWKQRLGITQHINFILISECNWERGSRVKEK